MSDLSWLAKLARKDGNKPEYDWTHAAFSLDGKTGVTDGMALVLVNAPSPCPPVPPNPAELCREILKLESAPALKTTKGALRVWCGRDPAKACQRCKDTDSSPCRWCGGSGKGRARECDDCGESHTCVCSHCWGGKTGPCECLLVKNEGDLDDESWPASREAQGWLAGILVNRDRLARLLAVELGPPDEEVAVYALKGKTGDRVSFVAENWQAVLMCIAPIAAVSGAPRFEGAVGRE